MQLTRPQDLVSQTLKVGKQIDNGLEEYALLEAIIKQHSPPLHLRSLALHLRPTLIHRLQIPLRRPNKLHTILTEPTAMHRTVPALLGAIPANHTLHMRAQRRELMSPSLIVLVNRSRLSGLGIVHHTALAIRQVFNIGDVRLQEAFVLRVDLQIVREHAAGALDDAGHALGMVDLRPVIVLGFDFVGEEATCDHAVGKAVA